jgi:hypothetical protein
LFRKPHTISVPALLCSHWSIFQCTFIAGCRINFQHAGFGATFRDTGGRRLLEGISQLVSDFIKSSRNFILDFRDKKITRNCENHKRSFKKYRFDSWAFKRNIHFATRSLLHIVVTAESIKEKYRLCRICTFQFREWHIHAETILYTPVQCSSVSKSTFELTSRVVGEGYRRRKNTNFIERIPNHTW